MTEVRTRDEALVAVDRALNQWASTTTGVLTQASAAASGARTTAAADVRKWANKAAAIEARLATLKDAEDPRPLQLQLARCQQSLQAASRAAMKIDEIAQQVSTLQRAHTQRGTSLVNEARADLSKRIGELVSYRASGNGSTGGGSTASPGGTTSGSPIASKGLVEVDVESATFADNPIVGSFGRSGTTRADYRRAVQTWHEVVGPGLSRGMTRDDFEGRDTERGADPLRRTAAVYDMFLGDADRIRVSRRADGSFDVDNGRHRLQVARELGIRSLPGQVAG